MKTVIEMARSVGARPQQNKNCDVEYLMSTEALEAFAELVRAEERDACELAVEELPSDADRGDCAAAIRARGNT